MHGKREYMRREVASLTKMMTCYTVIKLLRKFKLNPETTEVKVTDVAADISGTTASLKEGDVLTVD